MTDERYFRELEEGLEDAVGVARQAREMGHDPETDVEIPAAKDMADRVEKLLGIDGVADRIRDLEGEMSREEAALMMVEDFVEGTVGDYETDAGKIEGAVRSAVALLTEGVVAAPIEGIDLVEVLENDDGTEFVNVYYAGPIRSAGGTAQALSVLVADYARSLLGISEYKARDDEVERYAEEVGLYDAETGLQYSPKDAETKFIAENMPIMLDGEATGDEEVSGFRDLERVDTNNPRGGMCLVLAEGIALKAPKIQRYTRNLEEVEWPWLQDLIDGTIGDGEDGDEEASAEEDDGDENEDDERDGPPRAEPHKKYLRDLIAGRPVFSHPSEAGGFRLRYGRARNHGFATAGVHPATMHLVGDFLATGTQIKTERPGKAAGVVPVDTIEGPTVRLANGDVRRIDDPAEALEIRNGVEKIVDLGEYLVNYGEFVENNHPLSPASYTVEWWEQELAETEVDLQALRDDPTVDLANPSVEEALEYSDAYGVPLHPTYTYLWHDVSVDDFVHLADAICEGTVEDGVLSLSRDDRTGRILEALLVEHFQGERIEVETWRPLALSVGVDVEGLARTWEELPAEAREYDDGDNAVAAVNAVAPFEVRERAPTRVGNRMGRPEKSEKRELSPAVHALFPIGEAGGSQRDVGAATSYTADRGAPKGEVEVDVGRRVCEGCGAETFQSNCPECGGHTTPEYRCPDCDQVVDPDEAGRVECSRCEVEATAVHTHPLDVREQFRSALDRVGERENAFDVLKGVKGLTSTVKTPEPLEKGVLRAKHGVSAFKDGTVRYDMTDLPVTAVRPDEMDVEPGQLRELGYEADVHGAPLEHGDQLVELKVQDVLLSDGGAEYMMKTAAFVDDLLENFYGLDPYYELEDRQDLVGELVFGMAPHTSAATVARVVGFTSAAVGYAHPYFHAAKRRNCFHPDTKVWYEDGGEVRHERIEDLVEDRLTDPREDDFGALVQELDGDVFVPSVDSDGLQVRKPVTAVSKHPAQDHVVEVQTQSGRELVVTPDHRMQVYDHDADGIQTKEARKLTEDDHLVSPTHLDVMEPSEDPAKIDLLAKFVRTEAVDTDRLMIKGLEKERLYTLFEETLADQHEGEFYALYSTAEHLGMSEKTLSNYLYRESIPAEVLLEFFESVEELLAFVPVDVALGMKRDRTEIDRFVEVNERVATLLGYYAAEGFARQQDTEKGTIHQTTICGTESEARKFYLDALQEEFGVDPYEENHAKVTVSGRLLRTFFDTVLDAGTLAETKRVPQCIFDAPDRVVGAYLGGYVSGDGSVDAGSLCVSAATVSSELKEDLVALCSRLGIDVNINRPEPVPLHEKFPEFYDENADRTTAQRYVLTISSDDAVQFEQVVPVHLSRKAERLRTNVESITPRTCEMTDGGVDDARPDPVESITVRSSRSEWTYSVTVADTHSLIVNDLSEKQCDGDEDCVMLLMDGLLNFSKSYLPDQRGGSVAESSRLIAFDPDGSVRFLTFDEFWNRLDSEVKQDGKFEKKTCLSEGWKTYAFDDDHRSEPRPIEKAIRYRASENEQLLRVETQFGRSVDITTDHSLFRYDDGIEEVAGADLSEGDLIVAPRSLDVDPVETTIDVADCVEEPYVFIDDRIEDLLRTIWEGSEHGSETHAAFESGLSYRLRKRKIPFDRLAEIVEAAEGIDTVPTDVTIGRIGSETGIDREIELDEEFGWLLGVFVAEGTLSSVNPCIHNADEELVDRVCGTAESALGHDPETRWSNRAWEVRLPAVFEDVLHTLGFEDRDSYNSSEKVVPESILGADREIVLAFLRGFIAGDGSKSSDDNATTVGFHTTSEDVKDGIVFLLHRLGLVANVSRRQRDDPRQPIYNVSVSGGASDNPLERILDGTETYLPKSLVVTVPDALMQIREMDIEGVRQVIPKYLKRRENVSIEKLREMTEMLEARDLPPEAAKKLASVRSLVDGDLSYLRVQNVERVDYDGHLYDLQVGGEPVFAANWLYAHNSMDAPLVMSSRIDPTQIDDEAHNVDIVPEYPLDFYEATREMAHPEDVDIEIGEDRLDTDRPMEDFAHTHDTTRIDAGPDLSAYKTLGDMEEKMDNQLELARKLRAVDETDVAERIIEYHFLPDLLGNLRAFSRQEVRCLDCGEKYRRFPLSGDCRECGGDVNLTVHEGSVNKYLETATRIAEEYGTRKYTKQRLEVLERSINSIFENDKNKRSTLGEFM